MMIPIYLGEHSARRAAIGKTVEITVLRDVEDEAGEPIGRQRVKRRGVLNRAEGFTFSLGMFVYHINEVLSAHEVRS